MIPQRVSLITIGAKDLPNLRSFYKKLGWSETEASSDDYSVFRTAGVLLSLFPLHELMNKSVETLVGFKGITLAINVDHPNQVDEVTEEVRKAGGKIIREASDAFWGGRTSYLLDPEGNAWEVAWNPSAVFDERGVMEDF